MLTPSPEHVRAAAARLRQAAQDGRLAQVCQDHAVELLTLHGSVARGEPDPRDIDVAVQFASAEGDLLDLMEALAALIGCEVDVMDLRTAGVTARARGLGHGAEPLHESRPGIFAEAQMAALGLEMDFAPLRREQLRVLAGR